MKRNKGSTQRAGGLRRRDEKPSGRRRARRLLALALCAAVMLLSLGYMLRWEWTRRKIERSNAAFSALYPEASASPAAVETDAGGARASSKPATDASASPSPAPTPGPTPAPTAQPSIRPTAVPTPDLPVFEAVLDATRAPLATPDGDTRIFALESPPPVQPAFGDLLATNPETVGFLRMGERISLPVVQRKNDNEYYLNHAFNLEESSAGTLFLDGSNLLVPEDACLILYGHNMRNGTMFHSLCAFEDPAHLKAHPLARFDTLYQNRVYVPFAALTVTAEPDSARYVDLRQFALEGAAFDAYVADLRAHATWTVPVDVAEGDRLLLLVTCEYTHDNGRFVVALRAQRPGETEDELAALVQRVKLR